MAVSKSELAIYPEEYLVEEDEEMSESAAQFYLIKYIVEVLEWYYRTVSSVVIGNLELNHPNIANSQHKITPDVLVFVGKVLSSQQRRQLTSWNVRTRGAPSVVFEVCSRSTWPTDIGGGVNDKPSVYGRIGVKEYWGYDPNDPPVWQNLSGQRLIGWRYDEAGQPQLILPDERGWYWSELLESWLVADGEFLRLYDRAGVLRLDAKTAAIQEQQARLQAERQARLQAELAEQQARLQAEQITQAALRVETERQARLQAESEMAALQEEIRRLRGEQA